MYHRLSSLWFLLWVFSLSIAHNLTHGINSVFYRVGCRSTSHGTFFTLSPVISRLWAFHVFVWWACAGWRALTIWSPIVVSSRLIGIWYTFFHSAAYLVVNFYNNFQYLYPLILPEVLQVLTFFENSMSCLFSFHEQHACNKASKPRGILSTEYIIQLLRTNFSPFKYTFI